MALSVYDERKAVVVVCGSLYQRCQLSAKRSSTRKKLSGLGNLCSTAAYNQGRLTLFFQDQFVRLTIKGGFLLLFRYILYTQRK